MISVGSSHARRARTYPALATDMFEPSELPYNGPAGIFSTRLSAKLGGAKA